MTTAAHTTRRHARAMSAGYRSRERLPGGVCPRALQFRDPEVLIGTVDDRGHPATVRRRHRFGQRGTGPADEAGRHQQQARDVRTREAGLQVRERARRFGSHGHGAAPASWTACSIGCP